MDPQNHNFYGSDRVTFVTAGGRQISVTRQEAAEILNDKLLNAKTAQEVDHSQDVKSLLFNDAYIKAHGPAEPIRGRFQPAEEQHPGIARAMLSGDMPESEANRAHGRFAVTNVPNNEMMPNAAQLHDMIRLGVASSSEDPAKKPEELREGDKGPEPPENAAVMKDLERNRAAYAEAAGQTPEQTETKLGGDTETREAGEKASENKVEVKGQDATAKRVDEFNAERERAEKEKADKDARRAERAANRQHQEHVEKP